MFRYNISFMNKDSQVQGYRFLSLRINPKIQDTTLIH